MQTDNLLDAQEKKVERRRPVFITIICVLQMLGIVAIPFLFINNYMGPYKDQMLYIILTAAGSLAVVYGLWNMKKWAVYLYIGLEVIHRSYAVYLGTFNPLNLIVPIIIIV